MPLPVSRPWSSTRIWSASRMVLTRWAIMSLAGSVTLRSRASRRPASVLTSRAEKLSSKINTSARFISARAMARRCRCPPEKLVPPWATGDSRPSGSFLTKSSAWAMRRASHSSPSVASFLPMRRFSAMVPPNRKAF